MRFGQNLFAIDRSRVAAVASAQSTFNLFIPRGFHFGSQRALVQRNEE